LIVAIDRWPIRFANYHFSFHFHISTSPQFHIRHINA
jgi:hypothetical protein